MLRILSFAAIVITSKAQIENEVRMLQERAREERSHPPFLLRFVNFGSFGYFGSILDTNSLKLLMISSTLRKIVWIPNRTVVITVSIATGYSTSHSWPAWPLSVRLSTDSAPSALDFVSKIRTSRPVTSNKRLAEYRNQVKFMEHDIHQQRKVTAVTDPSCWVQSIKVDQKWSQSRLRSIDHGPWWHSTVEKSAASVPPPHEACAVPTIKAKSKPLPPLYWPGWNLINSAICGQYTPTEMNSIKSEPKFWCKQRFPTKFTKL